LQSLPKTTSDAPLLPHAASSALSTAAGVASNATFTVKTAVDDALAWTEAKVEKLSAKTEDGTGPYGSVSTCAPSDLDPIAQGVLPAALPVPRAKEDEGRGEGKGSHRTGEDIEINQGNKVEGGRSEGKRGEN
jgi:hypothetical protein